MAKQEYTDATNLVRMQLALHALHEMDVDKTDADSTYDDFRQAVYLLRRVENVLTARAMASREGAK